PFAAGAARARRGGDGPAGRLRDRPAPRPGGLATRRTAIGSAARRAGGHRAAVGRRTARAVRSPPSPAARRHDLPTRLRRVASTCALFWLSAAAFGFYCRVPLPRPP